jgi:hypothetical protein
MTSPFNTYITASIFSLAHSYGSTTTVLSSYNFSNYDQGAPNNGEDLNLLALVLWLKKCCYKGLEPALLLVVVTVGIVNTDSLQLLAWSDSAMLLVQLR